MSGAPSKKNDITIYETFARHWWDDSNPIFVPLLAMVPARARYLARRGIDVRDKIVVDCGAGGGYVSGLLAERGARCVFAVDVAGAALRAGRAHVTNTGGAIRWVQGSADALPLADASVDVAVSTDVLVHLPDPERAVAEVARVLRPGGVFWFSTINQTWLARFVMITLGERLLRFVHRGTHDEDTFLSPARINQLCRAHGLVLEASEGVGPIGAWPRRGRIDLVMGRLPTRAVMWQGHARKPRAATPRPEPALG